MGKAHSFEPEEGVQYGGDYGPDFTSEEAHRRRLETTTWFWRTGLLWAVNRHLLHGLGVALTVDVEAEPGDPNYGQELTDEDRARLGYMWLWPTTDPEGWEMGAETNEAKAAALEESFPGLLARLERMDGTEGDLARLAAWIEQNAPDEAGARERPVATAIKLLGEAQAGRWPKG